MTSIISTIGTSLFSNYLKMNDNIKIHYEKIEKEKFKNYNNWIAEIEIIKRKVLPFAKSYKNSAEFKSLEKLFSIYKDKSLKLIFICSDSITSYLAATLIEEVINEKNNYEIRILVIDNLLPFDTDFVIEGLSKLILELENISGGFYSDKILNFTGGFKGVIPYLTIWGQINKIPLYYIYEESDVLIHIPQSPINIDYQLFEKFYDIFEELSKGVELSKSEFIKRNKLHDIFPTDLIYEIQDNGNYFIGLDPLGLIYWKHYQAKYFVFYATDEVLEEIEKQTDIQRIIDTKFWRKDIRQRKTEKKGCHYVFDDGKNQNRIYYFESEGKIYIYKTFQNHDLAEEFIKKNISYEEIIKKSKKTSREVSNV